MVRYAVFYIWACFWISCQGDLKTAAKEKNDLPVRSELGINPKIYYSENASKKAIVSAPKMMRREDSLMKTYFPDGVHVDIFDSLGNPATKVTAKYGEQNHQNNQLIAHDSVEVINVNGKILKTNHLIWMPNENKMISYGAVEIRDQREVIYGDTLHADENLKRYVVKKVRGIIHVNK